MRAGYTQAEFAHEANVFRTYMGHIERGTANPTVEVLSGIARALGLGVAELFALAEGTEGEDQPQAKPSRRKRRG